MTGMDLTPRPPLHDGEGVFNSLRPLFFITGRGRTLARLAAKINQVSPSDTPSPSWRGGRGVRFPHTGSHP